MVVGATTLDKVLGAVSDRQRRNARTISKLTGLHRRTVRNALKELLQQGLVEVNEISEAYVLTQKAVAIRDQTMSGCFQREAIRTALRSWLGLLIDGELQVVASEGMRPRHPSLGQLEGDWSDK